MNEPPAHRSSANKASFTRRIFIAASVCCAAVLFGYFFGIPAFGEWQARRDIEKGWPAYLVYGEPCPEEEIASVVMIARYGIRAHRIAGCWVSDVTRRRVDAYNRVISAHFGIHGTHNADLFEAIVNELHQKKQALAPGEELIERTTNRSLVWLEPFFQKALMSLSIDELGAHFRVRPHGGGSFFIRLSEGKYLEEFRLTRAGDVFNSPGKHESRKFTATRIAPDGITLGYEIRFTLDSFETKLVTIDEGEFTLRPFKGE